MIIMTKTTTTATSPRVNNNIQRHSMSRLFMTIYSFICPILLSQYSNAETVQTATTTTNQYSYQYHLHNKNNNNCYHPTLRSSFLSSDTIPLLYRQQQQQQKQQKHAKRNLAMIQERILHYNHNSCLNCPFTSVGKSTTTAVKATKFAFITKQQQPQQHNRLLKQSILLFVKKQQKKQSKSSSSSTTYDKSKVGFGVGKKIDTVNNNNDNDNKKRNTNSDNIPYIETAKTTVINSNDILITNKESKSSIFISPKEIKLMDPNERMDYIRSRINSIDLSTLFTPYYNTVVDTATTTTTTTTTTTATNNHNTIVTNETFLYDPSSICIIDNFLNDNWIQAMRNEAQSIQSTMIPSQSTKYDTTTNSIVSYNKYNVLSTQLQGGNIQSYQQTPLLLEYIVSITSTLSQRINNILLFESIAKEEEIDILSSSTNTGSTRQQQHRQQQKQQYLLSTTQQTNKLAVCLGNGSSYDKHIDNLGSTIDQRKLTVLLYLQQPGSYYNNNIDNNNTITSTTTGSTSTSLFIHQQQDNIYEHDTILSNAIVLDPRGGYFRAYDVPNTIISHLQDNIITTSTSSSNSNNNEKESNPIITTISSTTSSIYNATTWIAPKDGRLIIFWSDTLVHDVSPSFVCSNNGSNTHSTSTTSSSNPHHHNDYGNDDHRWALTTWLLSDTTNGGQIFDTPSNVINKHFSI